MAKQPIHVSLVVFPESDPSIIFGVFDTLWAAGQLWESLHGRPAGRPLFQPRLVGAQQGPISLVTGVSIIPQDTIDDVRHTDIVFVPNVIVNSPEALRALDRRLLAWVRERFEAGAHIYASCGGSLVLAEAGLLDKLEATTHWAYVDLFRREYPAVRLSHKRVLVQTGPDQRIVCSGGASSWQDLVLFLVAKHGSAEEALRLSKLFLYQWHREGQLPYACMMQNVDHDDHVIGEQQVWIAENYARSNLVAELVRRSRLPESTFSRRFKAATGYTPLAYIQTLRIEEAKQMLEASSDPVELIAAEVGYEDLAHFRRLFRRLTGMSPAGYRRKFRLPDYAARAAGEHPIVIEAGRFLAS